MRASARPILELGSQRVRHFAVQLVLPPLLREVPGLGLGDDGVWSAWTTIAVLEEEAGHCTIDLEYGISVSGDEGTIRRGGDSVGAF